jgi:hypothetical protein
LVEENSTLSENQKNFIGQISALKHQLAKKRPNLHAQVANANIVCETKVQASALEVKSKDKKIAKELLNATVDSVREFYDLASDEFDNESFKHISAHIQEDLINLHIFQKNSSKYKD